MEMRGLFFLDCLAPGFALSLVQMSPVFFFFSYEVLEHSGWLLPDKRHVFVWHWVGGLHHLVVRLVAVRSSVPTQRQRAKTIIRGN